MAPPRPKKRPLIRKKVGGTDAKIRFEKNRTRIEQEAPEIDIIRERGGVPTIKEKHVKKGKLPRW